MAYESKKESESMCGILGQSLVFTLFIVFHIFLCLFGTKNNSPNFQTLQQNKYVLSMLLETTASVLMFNLYF